MTKSRIFIDYVRKYRIDQKGQNQNKLYLKKFQSLSSCPKFTYVIKNFCHIVYRPWHFKMKGIRLVFAGHNRWINVVFLIIFVSFRCGKYWKCTWMKLFISTLNSESKKKEYRELYILQRHQLEKQTHWSIAPISITSHALPPLSECLWLRCFLLILGGQPNSHNDYLLIGVSLLWIRGISPAFINGVDSSRRWGRVLNKYFRYEKKNFIVLSTYMKTLW
jgi:hypothetical protein